MRRALYSRPCCHVNGKRIAQSLRDARRGSMHTQTRGVAGLAGLWWRGVRLGRHRQHVRRLALQNDLLLR